MLDNSGQTTRRVILIENGREVAQAPTMPEWAYELNERIQAAAARTTASSRD